MKYDKPYLMLVAGACMAVAGGAPALAGQSASPTAQELTRMLNSRPPQATVPAASPAPAATPATPVTTTSRPVAPIASAPAQVRAAPVASDAVKPDAEAQSEAAPPTPPPVQIRQLGPAAIAALPFRIDLNGAQIAERPAGADAKIYSVSRAGKPLLMIYAGPQSDYPIYDGEQAVVADRTSVLLNDGIRRRAVEHLFRRTGQQPSDIHIWVIAQDGPEGDLAEQIGQTVDPR